MKEKVRYDSYCGLYCGACDVLFHNENGSIKGLAKEWGRELEDLLCYGCKTNINSIYCRECAIKKCCNEKQLENCFGCKQFPCKTFISFRNDDCEHHSIVIKNLESLNEVGLDSWLKNQKERWLCSCGQRFTWYEEVCQNCGTKLFNCVDEGKSL